MGSHTRASPLCRYIQPPPAPTTIMTQVQGSNLLDVLKKKMRQTKEEMEKYKEESKDMARKLQVEICRREEAEGEVAALNRRIQLLEDDLEGSEERLNAATQKLAEASHAADESERIRKALENKNNMEDDRVAILEAQLAQAKLIAEEADKKYEEVARKLAMVEADLERAEERAESGESKNVELEEELRVVGQNLKSLEVFEEKASQKEETYSEQIRHLTAKHKEVEARAEFAERSVQKLQKELDSE